MKPVSKKRSKHYSNKPDGSHTLERLDAKFV